MGFHPDSLIQMANGSTKPIRDVLQGDQVSCGDGRVAFVRRVVWNYGPSQTVTFNSFTLTPKHPVRFHSGAWVYPLELAACYQTHGESSSIVNIELDAHHELVGIHDHGTIACLTLGHAGWANPLALFDQVHGLTMCDDAEPYDYCSVCGVSDTDLWKFECRCMEYCSNCIPSKCTQCIE